MSETAELFRADAKRLADFGQHEYAEAMLAMAKYCDEEEVMTNHEITKDEKMPCFRVQFDATGDLTSELEAALTKLTFSLESDLLLHMPADSEIAEIVVDETELSREVQSEDWTILSKGAGALERFVTEVEKLSTPQKVKHYRGGTEV